MFFFPIVLSSNVRPCVPVGTFSYVLCSLSLFNIRPYVPVSPFVLVVHTLSLFNIRPYLTAAVAFSRVLLCLVLSNVRPSVPRNYTPTPPPVIQLGRKDILESLCVCLCPDFPLMFIVCRYLMFVLPVFIVVCRRSMFFLVY